MPFFYVSNYTINSSSAANATIDSYKMYGPAASGALKVCGVYVAAYSTSAGGYDLRLARVTTVGTGGAAYVPLARDPYAPATTAQTISTNNTTAGTGLTVQLTVGAPATGGMGGWIMIDPDAAIKLAPGATTTSGSIQAFNICAVASVTADHTIEWIEQ